MKPDPEVWRAVPQVCSDQDDVLSAEGRLICRALPNDARKIAAALRMLETLHDVEEWWLSRGMHVFGAAPPCIAKVRKVIHEATTP